MYRDACCVVRNRWGFLANFHKKYNKALLDKLMIEREQARLEQENAELAAILKQYLEGVSVSSSVLSEPNPLLVVNGRVNLTQRLPVARMYPTPAVEAVHMVETGRVNTRRGL